MPDAAFLSLARRLGNPIAERPDAVGLLELVTLTRVVQAGSSWRRAHLMAWRRAQLKAVAWLRRSKAEGSGHESRICVWLPRRQ